MKKSAMRGAGAGRAVLLALTVLAGGAGAFANDGVREAQPGEASRVGWPQFPSLSPDGSVIVFSSAGDLWAAPADGGAATRITSHPANDRRSAFSPDGKSLAFESDREGGRNLYIATIARQGPMVAVSGIRRVTYLDRPQTLSGFTPDGTGLVFSANLDPAGYRGTKMYVAPLDGGPVRRLSEAWGLAPRMSGDGKTLWFMRRRPEYMRPRYRGSATGDVWKMDIGNGQFTQVTMDAATDGDPMPLADGSVVFISTRDGQCNLWKINAGKSDKDAVKLTNFAVPAGKVTIGHGVRDLDVSADGRRAVFCVWDAVYTLDLTKQGSQPVAVKVTTSADAPDLDTARLNLSREVSEQALSPDGKTLAVVARGEVFIRSVDEGRPTRRVTFTTGRERGLAWSPDNRVLFFASDDGGTSRICYATVALTRDDLVGEKDKKVDEPEKKPDDVPSGDKKPEGEKKDDEKKDGEKGEPEKKDAAPAKPKVDWGKKWAEAVRFEVRPLSIPQLARGRSDGLFGPEDRSPVVSPDGKKLMFVRGLGDVIVVDLVKKEARRVLDGWNEPELLWAGDSRHIVIAREDTDFNSDIWVLDTGDEKAQPQNITRHPDTDDSPQLSADGKVLYFRSERQGENGEFDVFGVFLDRKLEGLRGYELDEYFKKAIEAAKKRKVIDPVMWDEPAPVAEAKADEPKDGKGDAGARPARAARGPVPLKFDVDDAYLRVRRLTSMPGSESNLTITPAGDRVLFTAEPPPTEAAATPGPTPGAAGPGAGGPSRTLFSISYKGDDRKTVTTGALGSLRMSYLGDKLSWISGGSVSSSPVAGGKTDALAIDAPVVIDIAAQQRQKFMEGARVLGNGFYHPTLKDLDWVALASQYLEIASKTRTSEEFDRVFLMLLNELDGSHLGVNSPGGFSAASPATGYLGVDVEPSAKGYLVKRVVRKSPADAESSRLEPGDVIIGIEGRNLARDGGGLVDLGATLAGRAGKETLLEVERADKTRPRQLLIVPTSNMEDSTLRYRDEVARRREMVEKLSGGRLGYLHIRGMDQASVLDFERDLYAAAHGKDGLVIDVRDNGGGSTADILLASLTAPRHAYTANRGVDVQSVPKDAYPRDRRLIYGYSRPLVVLINENSYSNAEIFAHSIKTTGRGKLVGIATFGAVISTGAATLIDGTTVRTPFRGWYLPDGRDMENNGAEPDIRVEQTPADEAAGKDAQLEAAVQELLQRAK